MSAELPWARRLSLRSFPVCHFPAIYSFVKTRWKATARPAAKRSSNSFPSASRCAQRYCCVLICLFSLGAYCRGGASSLFWFCRVQQRVLCMSKLLTFFPKVWGGESHVDRQHIPAPFLDPNLRRTWDLTVSATRRSFGFSSGVSNPPRNENPRWMLRRKVAKRPRGRRRSWTRGMRRGRKQQQILKMRCLGERASQRWK